MEAEGRAPRRCTTRFNALPYSRHPFHWAASLCPSRLRRVGLATRAVVILRSAGIDLIRSGVECGDGR